MKIYNINHAPLNKVTLHDDFWAPLIDKISTVTLPDILDKFESHGYFDNFDMVTRGDQGKHNGPPWSDGLIYETIRGASDFLTNSCDEKLNLRLDSYINRIAFAAGMEPDGYINTYCTMMCKGQRWGQNGGSLIWQHEVYNIGALVEAAVHHYLATGKTKLLDVAVKAANYMCAFMGEPPKHNVVPAHPLPEEALIKLYRLFRDTPELIPFAESHSVDYKDYLRLATFWLDKRGYHDDRLPYPKYFGEYTQDHRPLIEQKEAVGHVVRASLLYTGLAAAIKETKYDKYVDAALALWNNVIKSKIHITGGVGVNRGQESFGARYQLPNDAYLETCASVAFAFWAGEMHSAFGNVEYIDYLERALYNNILASVSDDGHRYFYENPLISDGSVERWDWHGCPCCPPMLFKIISCFKTYIYSVFDKTIYINMLVDSEFIHNGVKIIQKNGRITITSYKSIEMTVKVRVPDYVSEYTFYINGEKSKDTLEDDGYFTVTKIWNQSSNVIELKADIKIRRIQAHPYVDADHGRVAILYGPFVYCAEGIDNEGDVEFALDDTALSYDITAGTIKGRTTDGKVITLISYYRWNNRGKSKMAVWLKEAGLTESKFDLNGWENLLYRTLRYE